MRTRYAILPLALLVIASAFALSSQAPQQATLGTLFPQGSSSACSTVPRSAMMFASWAQSYDGLASMKAASTAVLEGTVVSANSYVGGRSCSIIFTTLSVRVDTAIKGVAANTIIKVVQTGGTVNGSKQEVEDDSLMAVGQQAFLFLRLDQSSGRYVILGGPQGQLPVIDRHVYTLDQIQSGGNIVLPWSVAGQPEQSFAASLEG